MLAWCIQKHLTTHTYSIHRPRLSVCGSDLILQPSPNPGHGLVVCRSETLAQGAESLSAILTSQIPFKSQTGHRTWCGGKKMCFIFGFFQRDMAQMTAVEKHVSMSGREKGPTLELLCDRNLPARAFALKWVGETAVALRLRSCAACWKAPSFIPNPASAVA